MALAVVRTSIPLLPTSASKFPAGSGDARRPLPNGAGIAAFGAELTICGRAEKRSFESRWSSRSEAWRGASLLRNLLRSGEARPWASVRGRVSVRAMAENEVAEAVESSLGSTGSGEDEEAMVVHAKGLPNQVTEAKGLQYDGPGKGGQWLSSTTRHVRIYIGVADPESKLMDQTQLDKVTLILDPDNEFIWPDDKVQKVYDYFAELVEGYAGAPCTEYTLRLIGSDIEHYIRKLLLGNEIKYNLDCRVLNFSMGKPRYESGIIEEAQE